MVLFFKKERASLRQHPPRHRIQLRQQRLIALGRRGDERMVQRPVAAGGAGATRRADGSLAYDPKARNTVIVIVGDNGSFANADSSNSIGLIGGCAVFLLAGFASCVLFGMSMLF